MHLSVRPMRAATELFHNSILCTADASELLIHAHTSPISRQNMKCWDRYKKFTKQGKNRKVRQA